MIFYGILLGLIFGVPAGTVGVLVVRNTFSGGIKSGIATGLGSSVADCIYAVIGTGGYTLVYNFIMRNQCVINYICGALILLMGILVLIKRPDYAAANEKETAVKSGRIPAMFMTSFAIAITNPASILTFIFGFSWLGIEDCTGLCRIAALVSGIFLGTLFWWCLLSSIIWKIRMAKGEKIFPVMNRICGSILLAFAAVILIRNV